jgi:cysteine-rich repeat protein
MNLGNLACDDGNTDLWDGCDAGCNVEDGWYCWGGDYDDADGCYEICGDGYHIQYDYESNQCDDGNSNGSNTFDGCYECQVDDGWCCETDWEDYDLPT